MSSGWIAFAFAWAVSPGGWIERFDPVAPPAYASLPSTLGEPVTLWSPGQHCRRAPVQIGRPGETGLMFGGRGGPLGAPGMEGIVGVRLDYWHPGLGPAPGSASFLLMLMAAPITSTAFGLGVLQLFSVGVAQWDGIAQWRDQRSSCARPRYPSMAVGDRARLGMTVGGILFRF